MDTFTITITNDNDDIGYIQAEGDYWTKDDEGNLFVYADDKEDPMAEVPADAFAGIVREHNPQQNGA